MKCMRHATECRVSSFEENLRPPKPPLEGRIPKFKRDVWSMCRAFCLFWLLPTYFGSYRIYDQRWNSFKWKEYVGYVHWNGQIHCATCPKGRLPGHSPTHSGTNRFVVIHPRQFQRLMKSWDISYFRNWLIMKKCLMVQRLMQKVSNNAWHYALRNSALYRFH